MKVLVAYPPMFEEIAAVFPQARKPGVVFTWGNMIYNPSDTSIAPQIMAHESVHSQRQGQTFDEIAAWWKRYLHEPRFRLEEELEAHRAEYRAFKSWAKDRNDIARELHTIAARLSSQLYGGLLTYGQARRFIVVQPGG